MRNFMIRRLLGAIPVILGVLTLSFALVNLLPGDPAAAMLARSGASPDQIAALRHSLGLDQPLLLRYLHYLWDVVRGHLGHSIASQQPVAALLAARVPMTLQLVFAAMSIAVPFGTAIGIIASMYQNRWLDKTLVAATSIGLSVPAFWAGLMLILVFSVGLGLLPASGEGSWRHLLLPAITLAIGPIGTIARTARASMVEVLRQDYVLTAHARGLPEARVILVHALPNALIPLLTLIGLQFGWLLSGTFIVESVFSRPGLGTLMVTSILDKDLPVVQGAILVSALLYVLANILVDLGYSVLDPRIREA
ncbi:MAG: ABC transporter permease [Pseudomonas sp.]